MDAMFGCGWYMCALAGGKTLLRMPCPCLGSFSTERLDRAAVFRRTRRILICVCVCVCVCPWPCLVHCVCLVLSFAVKRGLLTDRAH
jgi:hypothetical protein